MNVLCTIYFEAIFEFHMQVSHISRVHNRLADSLSHEKLSSISQRPIHPYPAFELMGTSFYLALSLATHKKINFLFLDSCWSGGVTCVNPCIQHATTVFTQSALSGITSYSGFSKDA